MHIIDCILNILRIKHSYSFLEENYIYGPDNGNMLGVHRILKRYGVTSIGIHFKDKMNAEITVPCICHFPNKFVVVRKIENGEVYFDDGKRLRGMSEVQFCDEWDGTALLISDYSNASEPNYYYNKLQDYYQFIKYRVLFLCLCFCAVFSIVMDQNDIITLSNIILDFIGLLVCVLLLQKEIGLHNKVANKVCSLAKKGNCNAVIETREGSFLNLFSLSEIGFSYFLSSIIFLVVCNNLVFVIQSINWLAMLFGIWSIWFQFVKIKQICVLCCITQLIIWVTGIVNLCSIQFSTLYFRGFIVYGAVFVCCLIVVKIISDSEIFKKRNRRLRTNLLQIKGEEKVFNALSNMEGKMPIVASDSKIVIGNINAQSIITIVTNPHCSPCANAHKKLMRLIKNNKDIKVQLVFTEFSSELRKSGLYLIAIFLQKSYDEALSIMSDWYEYGRLDSENFISDSDVNIYDERVLSEYEKHITWIKNNNITSTPFVLYNCVPLPTQYDIEDFEYINI